MKNKSTKHALLASILSIVMCFAMLIGSTFAWFTDEVKSGMNKIVAGNLDVELYHSNGNVAEEKVDEGTKLFIGKDGNDILWEPGAMVYENFTVKNEGTLALKYCLTLNSNFNLVDGKSLKDVLKVAVIEGAFEGDRATAQALTFDKTLADFEQTGVLAAGAADDTYAIVIYWEPSDRDNDYNIAGSELFVEIGASLVATQAASENDSFGDQYDKDAASAQNMNAIKLVGQGYTPIKSLDDFEYELDGEAALISTDGKLFLNNDISKGFLWVFTSEDSVTLDLNGYSYERGGYVTSGGADLTITDSVGTGKLQTVAANQGTVTLENCSITDRSNTMMVIYPGAKMIINGGHYNPMMITTQGEGAILIINDGVFELKDSRYIQTQTGGSIIVNGGTFKLNIANIAGVTFGEGKQCVDNGDGTWTVK